MHDWYMLDTFWYRFSLNFSRIVWTLKDQTRYDTHHCFVSDRIRSYPIRIRQFWWMRERACIRSVSSVYWHVSNCIHTYPRVCIVFVSGMYRACIQTHICTGYDTTLYRKRHFSHFAGGGKILRPFTSKYMRKTGTKRVLALGGNLIPCQLVPGSAVRTPDRLRSRARFF